MTGAGPLLLYRDTCGKCRLLSRIAVLASLGMLTRAPLSSAPAVALLRRMPAARGKLVLAHGNGLVTGWRVIPATLSHTLRWLVGHGLR